MRGRKPTPTHLKVLEGNPGKRRVNTSEPQPCGDMPAPPDHLTADALSEWNRIAPGLNAIGLLTVVDRAALAAYCQAYGRWALAERAIAEMAKRDKLTGGLMIKTSNGNAIQNPLVGTANKAAADMVRYAAEFGLTPVARVRLGTSSSEKPSSKFGGLIHGVKNQA